MNNPNKIKGYAFRKNGKLTAVAAEHLSQALSLLGLVADKNAPGTGFSGVTPGQVGYYTGGTQLGAESIGHTFDDFELVAVV